MADRATEIFNELTQICAQYKAEVPSSRRAWPESVKTRVFELKAMGLSFVKISRQTGIAYQTITAWERPAAFLPVKVVDTKSPTVTVSNKPKQKSQLPTVTVITPSGYQIEGLDAKAAIEFIHSLEGR